MAKRPLDPTQPEDRVQILSHPTRLAIASACAREPLTIWSIAQRLGRRDGSLRNTVKQLVAWTVLRAPIDTPLRATYELNPDWESDLTLVEERQRLYNVRPGQRIVLVGSVRLPEDAVPNVGIEWVAEFANHGASLFALEDSSSGTPAVLEGARRSGIRADLFRVTDIYRPARS